MRIRELIAAVAVCLLSGPGTACAQTPEAKGNAKAPLQPRCSIVNNQLKIESGGGVLVARLENPPRTRVVLAIDGTGGLNRELVWDPTVGDGLQHDVLLPEGDYRLMAFADDDRMQTSQALLITSTRFFTLDEAKQQAIEEEAAKQQAIKEAEAAKKKAGTNTEQSPNPAVTGGKEAEDKKQVEVKRVTALMTSSIRTLVVPSSGTASFVNYSEEQSSGGQTPGTAQYVSTKYTPRLRLTCDDGRVELSRLRLNTKELQAGSVARGFLDQAAPSAVTDTLALIAEIAVERAKAGAMEIVKDRFVEPICTGLHLNRLGLGSEKELAFPRLCAMLRNMRIDDVLSSGRPLVEAARDDVRMTLLPQLVTKANLPPVAREVAKLALGLGNELLEGGGNESAALDLVMTQMDRILRIGAAAGFPALKQKFVNEALSQKRCPTGPLARLWSSAAELPTCLAEMESQRSSLIEAALLRLLPTDPGELLSAYAATTQQKQLAADLLLKEVKACEREKETARVFRPADKSACIEALKAVLAARQDWQTRLKKVLGGDDGLVNLLDSLRNRAGLSDYEEWLETHYEAWLQKPASIIKTIQEDLKSKAGIPATLETACALRVTVGVVKWCSNRDRCTAADIATAIEKPENLFTPIKNGVSLDGLCWDTEDRLRLPIVRGPYVELASRALAFLTPPAKGVERERVIAVLRWMLDVAKAVDLRGGTAETVQKLEEIVELFGRGDYARAISQTLLVALELRGCTAGSCVPDELKKALTLIGAVSSYVQVYEETKGKDPAEAKAARKKAIETLIDASTDRRERPGKWIFSLGVPVGLTGALRWKPGTSMDPEGGACFDARRLDCAVAWRLPLGIALQKMPGPGRVRGWHLGLTFADLGNFVRSDTNGKDEPLYWSDFVQVGAQFGFLFGNRRHSVLAGLDMSWSPGLYKRTRVEHDDGAMREVTRSGALMLGLTVAYYVPLFDLN